MKNNETMSDILVEHDLKYTELSSDEKNLIFALNALEKDLEKNEKLTHRIYDSFMMILRMIRNVRHELSTIAGHETGERIGMHRVGTWISIAEEQLHELQSITGAFASSYLLLCHDENKEGSENDNK